MVSEDQIHKHKEQRTQLEQKRKLVSALSTILSNLKEEYIRRKHTFPLVRYGKLKNMIKSAVDQFRNFHNKDGDEEEEKEKEEDGQSSHPTGLLGNAMKLAKTTESLRKETELYDNLSSKDIDKELNNFATEIAELEEQFQVYERNVKTLGESYEASKSLMPIQRYAAMKSMIKTCLKESSLL